MLQQLDLGVGEEALEYGTEVGEGIDAVKAIHGEPMVRYGHKKSSPSGIVPNGIRVGAAPSVPSIAAEWTAFLPKRPFRSMASARALRRTPVAALLDVVHQQ